MFFVFRFMRIRFLGLLTCGLLLTVPVRASGDELLDAKTNKMPAPGWREHIVRRMGGAQSDERIPAKLQIVSENWNRAVAVPFIVFMPEKDRLLMLASCDYPHRAMVLKYCADARHSSGLTAECLKFSAPESSILRSTRSV